MFPVEQHTIFLALAGSQAHGTARDGSDVDVRGVCIAPLAFRLSLFHQFEQFEGALPPTLAELVAARIQSHPTAARALDVKIECVVFDLAKFVGLCAAANPNALEILFGDERDWLFATEAWRRLHDERQHFLTQRVRQTFLGYAMAQLKRIQTHRSWLLNPPTKKPAREDFGLPAHGSALSSDDQNRIEQSIAETLRGYGIDELDMPKSARIALDERLETFYRDVLSAPSEDLSERLRDVATSALRLPKDVISTLNAEKRYRAAMKHWDSYQAWQDKRNPGRAELERRHGYDTKHAMHLIRLMRMGLEALERGDLWVRRNDAAELAAIRDGALTFEQVLAMAHALQEAIAKASESTSLPPDVDRERVDALLTSMLVSS